MFEEINITCDPIGLRELTKAELAILVFIVNGYSTSEIAAKVILSKKTINSHKSAIYRKLNIKNELKLCAWFWKQGRFEIKESLDSKNHAKQ